MNRIIIEDDGKNINLFFKYYGLKQYKGSELFSMPEQFSYKNYTFMKDKKLSYALEIDYKNNKVKVDLEKLYPNVDIAETLSNLKGKWIKKITEDEVEFEDGRKINLKDLNYKDIKSLIWW